MAPTSSVVRLLDARRFWLVAATSAAGFWIAYDDGSYGLGARSTLAILAWWFIAVVAVARGIRVRPSRGTMLSALALAALAGWALASVAWAPSAEAAFGEFDRDVLYLGVFVLATAAGRAAVREWLVDGATIAVTIVGYVALGSRLLPGVVHGRPFGTYLPATANRLSFPLGYWNGLAIFVALGLPLLFRAAGTSRHPLLRGAAVASMPIAGCVIYLASSRGGVVTAAVAILVYCAATGDRGRALLALVVGGAAAAVCIVTLLDRKQLVNGPLGTSEVRQEGLSAALVVIASCIAAGFVFVLASRLLDRRRLHLPTPRLVCALAVCAIAAAVVLAHPIRRFEQFKSVPGAFQANNYASAHLLSGTGSGRWQFWAVAFDEWRAHPLLGGGAGSYEEWWARHASFAYFIRDAHSLYLQTLGELGIVGAGLLGLFLVAALVRGIALIRRETRRARASDAALLAVVLAFLVAAGIDWMWELTAVGIVGVGALGLLVTEPAPERTGALRRGVPVRAALATIGVALAVAEAIPLLAQVEISASQDAVGRGQLAEAQSDALRARAIQPWAASPYLQLALTAELDGRLPEAQRRIRSAIVRDGDDWRLWLVAARVETKLGRPAAARRSLSRAIALNPRSPLFASFRAARD